MKAVRLLKWSKNSLSRRQPLRLTTTTTRIIQYPSQIQHRTQTTVAAIDETIDQDSPFISEDVLVTLPSPPITAAKTSTKLAALHARLVLPSSLPIETLARTLVDVSADNNQKFNNAAFSKLGSDLLAYWTSEYIICQFPRLPLAVVYAAMNAYCGRKALATITKEWGVIPSAAPGGEVDPGYLQFKHLPPTGPTYLPKSEFISTTATPHKVYGKMRHSISSRTVYDNAFGESRHEEASENTDGAVSLESASAEFVRAVVGAIYLHAGRSAAKKFFKDHFMSRQLNMANLMGFRTPTRDLSKLCLREGFQSPVARILSETGRLSRTPVFIVGVFSGEEKLGEGAGSSLDEARTRAAVAALKGWYLYSPLDWKMPSDAEENDGKWTPQHVDMGDVVL